MAFGILPRPGTDRGPCVGPCQHTDCAATKRDVVKPCPICGVWIGYEILFYILADGLLAHVQCAEEVEIESKLAESRIARRVERHGAGSMMLKADEPIIIENGRVVKVRGASAEEGQAHYERISAAYRRPATEVEVAVAISQSRKLRRTPVAGLLKLGPTSTGEVREPAGWDDLIDEMGAAQWQCADDLREIDGSVRFDYARFTTFPEDGLEDSIGVGLSIRNDGSSWFRVESEPRSRAFDDLKKLRAALKRRGLLTPREGSRATVAERLPFDKPVKV